MVTSTQSFTSPNSQHTFTTSSNTTGVEITLRGGKGGVATDLDDSSRPPESAGKIKVLVDGDIANRSLSLYVGQQGGHSGTRSAGSSPFQGGISGTKGGVGDDYTGDGGGAGAPSAIELNGNVIAVAGGGDEGKGGGDFYSDPRTEFLRGGSGGSAPLSDSYYQNVSTGNNDQTVFYSNPTADVSVSVQQSKNTNDQPGITVTDIRNPPAVNSLSATPQKDGSIDLSWLNPSQSVTKEIYRSTSHSGNATQIDTVGNSTTTYTDTGLDDGQSYVYYLKQVDSDGEKRGVVAAARTPNRDILRYNESKDEWVPTDLTNL